MSVKVRVQRAVMALRDLLAEEHLPREIERDCARSKRQLELWVESMPIVEVDPFGNER